MKKQRAPDRRNKLCYKNRWLISVDVVAALRRAGIECDIVVLNDDGVPKLSGDVERDDGLTKH